MKLCRDQVMSAFFCFSFCVCVCIWMVMRYTTMGVNYSNDESTKQPLKVSDQTEMMPNQEEKPS